MAGRGWFFFGDYLTLLDRITRFKMKTTERGQTWAARAAMSGLVAACLVGAGPRPAAGQVREGPAGSDPFGWIVEEVLANNLELVQAQLREEAAEARVREARGRFLPSLTVDSRYSDQSGAVDLGSFVNPANAALNQLLGEPRFPTDLSITLPFRHESRARLVQPLFNERIRAGYSASRHALGAQRAERRSTARNLAAEAQTAFLNVQAARSLRRIWESTVVLVEESERVSQRLVDAGSATPDAVFRARAERSDVEQKLQEAREQEDAAVRAFNQLLNRPLVTPVDTVAEISLRFPIPLSEEEALERGLLGREEMAGLQEGIGAAEASKRLATASVLPEVSVALDYGFQGRELEFSRNNDFWMASVVLSWNVFNGGQNAARRQAAESEVQRLRTRRQEVEDLIRLDVGRAYEAAVVARDAIGTAEDRLAAAQRTFELVHRRYEEGLATPVEFLDARTSFTNAELNRVVTVYRYAIRWVDLERAAALRDLPTGETGS